MAQIATATVAEDIMTADMLTAYEGWTIHRLAEFFIKRQISAAPVSPPGENKEQRQRPGCQWKVP